MPARLAHWITTSAVMAVLCGIGVLAGAAAAVLFRGLIPPSPERPSRYTIVAAEGIHAPTALRALSLRVQPYGRTDAGDAVMAPRLTALRANPVASPAVTVQVDGVDHDLAAGAATFSWDRATPTTARVRWTGLSRGLCAELKASGTGVSPHQLRQCSAGTTMTFVGEPSGPTVFTITAVPA